MKSNVVEKTVEAPVSAHRARRVSDRAARMMARTRYSAPTVASYTVSACEQSGPLSMIGNT